MILLTGGNGLLGTAFRGVFDKEGIAYDAPSRMDFDITNQSQVDVYFQNHEIKCILHCAAYTDVDGAEEQPDACYKVNVEGLRNLLKHGIPILHFSTDYVFSGEQQGYQENPERRALNVYGNSKIEAEKLLECHTSDWWNIRTSWIYGKGGKNFIDTMAQLLEEKKEVTVVDDQIGRLTNADDLARFVVKYFVEEEQQPGHYHLQGSGDGASWADIAKLIALYKKADIEIRAIKSGEYGAPAKRPNYSVLSNTKIDDQLPDWRESLKSYLE